MYIIIKHYTLFCERTQARPKYVLLRIPTRHSAIEEPVSVTGCQGGCAEPVRYHRWCWILPGDDCIVFQLVIQLGWNLFWCCDIFGIQWRCVWWWLGHRRLCMLWIVPWSLRIGSLSRQTEFKHNYENHKFLAISKFCLYIYVNIVIPINYYYLLHLNYYC